MPLRLPENTDTDWKIYGPYLGKDGRLRSFIVETLKDGSKRKETRSYPKLLAESLLSEPLGADETVDHHDKNPLNNAPSNLRVIKRSEHSKLDAVRVSVPEVSCIWCLKNFIPTRNQYNSRAETKAGPFCSPQCVGEYDKSIQQKKKLWNENLLLKHILQLKNYRSKYVFNPRVPKLVKGTDLRSVGVSLASSSLASRTIYRIESSIPTTRTNICFIPT